MESSETCETCRFWTGGDKYDGSCRRMPPQLCSDEDDFGSWPVTAAIDWCGEWAAKDDTV